jgi:hypothetical protein
MAAFGNVAIECKHGYDVCPICDECRCNMKHRITISKYADLYVMYFASNIRRISFWSDGLIILNKNGIVKII